MHPSSLSISALASQLATFFKDKISHFGFLPQPVIFIIFTILLRQQHPDFNIFSAVIVDEVLKLIRTRIRSVIGFDSFRTIDSFFVHSTLDYCNSM